MEKELPVAIQPDPRRVNQKAKTKRSSACRVRCTRFSHSDRDDPANLVNFLWEITQESSILKETK
ncbi:hypothetical protein [Thermaerobacillus caldiproteolyticus]|uniref:Uncharacterized protein n=1 Tax=Thermaerobacillus caldiproteolyticus TaxID=247480 RepID=A0A7W0BYE2_9BACL|nr:hypothetical protein [Anoxybacillus caldiproteolyticus]MBA2875601.1 hypothetical protein [Anoxybacillus caldiproteolyticus]